MKLSGGQIVRQALKDAKVHYSFGIPGTHNIELYDALSEEESHKAILVTDEQCASFMADGVARVSGELAVVNVVPGAGLTHSLSGISEAFLDCVPLLVLACGIRSDTGNAYQLHDVDQAAFVRPVTKKVFEPQTHQELYKAIREACYLAQQFPKGPVAVIVPANLYLFTDHLSAEDLTLEPSQQNKILESTQFKEIIDLLNHSSSIGLYIGSGARSAYGSLVELADHLDAVVFSTISAKGLFPENHVRWAWNTMGSALPPSLHEFEKNLDCLLAIGCRFAEVATASYGFHPPENLIHIDVDAKVFNKNYPAKLTLEGDAGEVIRLLLDSADLNKKEPQTEKLNKLAQAHDKIKHEQTPQQKNEERVSPSLLLSAFQESLGPDTVYVVDSGNGMFIGMENLRLTKPDSFLGPFDYSCMGYSVPGSIGAKFGAPHRPVVALVGDGAFLMTGMEMLTAVHENVGVIFCILRDHELSQIAQFQKQALNRKTLTTLPPLDLDSMAKAFGLDYLSIQNDLEIGDIVSKACLIVKENKPVLLEVAIDYAKPTYFSKGVIKTNFLRLPWKDRFRFVGRVVKRKVF